LFASQYLLGEESFPQGTWVAGEDLSGLTREQAAQALASRTEGFADAEYRFILKESVSTVRAQDLGARLDLDSFLDGIMQREKQRGVWERLNHHQPRHYALQVPIVYDQKLCAQAVERLAKSLNRPVKICRVRWDAQGVPTLVPGHDGVRVDQAATIKSLPTAFSGDKSMAVKLAAKVEPVGVDAADLKDQVVLGQFTTFFSPTNVNRSSNLRIAASALNGAVVPAGQEFSFNVAVGPRELSTGYKEALIILKNEFTPGVGGGICQVSSTLYNACLLANLPIVERHNHSVAVPYALPGTDATVTYKSKDFRFRNDTGKPVCIRAFMHGSSLTVQILGQRREAPVNVKIERQVIGVTDFKEIRKADPELALGQERVDHEGVKGCRVVVYRAVYDQDGQLLSRERLSADTYKPLDKLVFIGTKVDGTPIPEPPPVTPDPTQPPNPNAPPEQPPPTGGETQESPMTEPVVTDHTGG